MKAKSLNSISTTTTVTRRWFAAFVLPMLLASALMLRAADNDYVAHEWGTFTSVQGGDGTLLNWDGIATSDLPPFVYDWSRPGLERYSPTMFSKVRIPCLQRMETPVIYFYPRKPMTLDVAVQFPRGRITEWFPQAIEAGPSRRLANLSLTTPDALASLAWLNLDPNPATLFGESAVTNSIIRWKNFEVLPAKQNPELANQLPTDAKASHYFAARTKDAAFVRVNSFERTHPAPEIEKFLFYRGVGNFQSPLKVTMNEQGQVSLTNTGVGPLKHLFALAIQGDRVMVVPLGNLEPGHTRVTQLNAATDGKPATATVKSLARQMADALETEGLYRAEAEAMVETWRDAWFEDQGVRILYVLPRAWTDSILPITLTPHPRELVRVMVGRAEVITPAMEQLLCKCVAGFRQSDPVVKQAAVSEFRAMKLGRFAPVAWELARSHIKDAKFFEDGLALIQAARAADMANPASASATQPARRLPASGG